MKKIVALFSGEGTNLANLIDKLHLKHCAIVCAITNNPEAGGIAKARAAGIPVDVLDHRDYESRESYDAALVKLIDEYQPDLVVLCGFMRILTPVFTSQVRSINLHRFFPHSVGPVRSREAERRKNLRRQRPLGERRTRRRRGDHAKKLRQKRERNARKFYGQNTRHRA